MRLNGEARLAVSKAAKHLGDRLASLFDLDSRGILDIEESRKIDELEKDREHLLRGAGGEQVPAKIAWYLV